MPPNPVFLVVAGLHSPKLYILDTGELEAINRINALSHKREL